MSKFAAIALAATIGIAGLGLTKPAEARVYVDVGVGLPAVALVAPSAGVYAPHYYYGHAYYGYRPGFVRYGYGFHGYAYGHRWR